MDKVIVALVFKQTCFLMHAENMTGLGLPTYTIPEDETALQTVLRELGNPSHLESKVKFVGHLTDTGANVIRFAKVSLDKSPGNGMYSKDQIKDLMKSDKLEKETKEFFSMFWRNLWTY